MHTLRKNDIVANKAGRQFTLTGNSQFAKYLDMSGNSHPISPLIEYVKINGFLVMARNLTLITRN